MADNDEKVEKTEEKIDPGKLPDPIGDDEEEPVPDDLAQYEQYKLDEFEAPPVAGDDFMPQQTDAAGFTATTELTAEQAMKALKTHIKQRCCWGARPMKKMKVKSITPTTAYKYLINSWNERRKVNWKRVPYRGGPVDGPYNGKPPGIWEMDSERPAEFVQETFHYPVPHTQEVRMCLRCHGRGHIRCYRCYGRGHVDCTFCQRGVKSNGEHCDRCGGDGRRRCATCHGRGYRRCFTCKGHGQLLHFLQLTVDFKDHDDEYIYELTDLPDELILEVSGTELLKEKAYRIGCVFGFPINEINEASEKLVKEHETAWPSELCHQQKHELHAVPVYEIAYEIDDEQGRFWVFGTEERVFSFDYPAQCCKLFNCPKCCSNCDKCNSCTIL